MALSDDGPGHVDAAAQFGPGGHVSGGVIAEHAGGILPDQQVVLAVAVVIARADRKPIVRVNLADKRPDSGQMETPNRGQCPAFLSLNNLIMYPLERSLIISLIIPV